MTPVLKGHGDSRYPVGIQFTPFPRVFRAALEFRLRALELGSREVEARAVQGRVREQEAARGQNGGETTSHWSPWSFRGQYPKLRGYDPFLKAHGDSRSSFQWFFFLMSGKILDLGFLGRVTSHWSLHFRFPEGFSLLISGTRSPS